MKAVLMAGVIVPVCIMLVLVCTVTVLVVIVVIRTMAVFAMIGLTLRVGVCVRHT